MQSSVFDCYLYSILQGLRKSEGSSERLEHLVKIKDQSIKTIQQEITVRLLALIILSSNRVISYSLQYHTILSTIHWYYIIWCSIVATLKISKHSNNFIYFMSM